MFKKSLLAIITSVIFVAGPVSATTFTSDFNDPAWQVANGSLAVISDNSAQLTTSATQLPVTLFQDFDAVQPFSVSFWLKWTPSSNLEDFISADLADATSGLTALLNAPLLDPSDPALLTGKYFTALLDPAFVGNSLELNFTITDVDGIADTLDIAFNADPIPEPSTMLLLLVGAAGLGLTRRRQATK